jgi:hypothetical protein
LNTQQIFSATADKLLLSKPSYSMEFARTTQGVEQDVRFPASHSAAASTIYVSSWHIASRGSLDTTGLA